MLPLFGTILYYLIILFSQVHLEVCPNGRVEPQDNIAYKIILRIAMSPWRHGE